MAVAAPAEAAAIIFSIVVSSWQPSDRLFPIKNINKNIVDPSNLNIRSEELILPKITFRKI